MRREFSLSNGLGHVDDLINTNLRQCVIFF